MGRFSRLVLFGTASLAFALVGLFGVVGGARSEWHVPLYAGALIYGSIGTVVCIAIMVSRGLRWLVERVR